MKRIYLCIDLKTFYASAECAERNLNPFKTNLVVADINRGKNALCLAITPKMKSFGIKNRCRLSEIPSNIKPIIVKPRMRLYLEYAKKIYNIYLKYVAEEDIHVYSVDEAFLDVTSYLRLYKDEVILAKIIMQDIYNETKIASSTGIGTNLYLAKVALDILAKHSKTNIAYLNEETYKKLLWNHTPLTDFWQIGEGISKRLEKLGLKDMSDIAHANPDILYKEFGKVSEILISHAYGKESCTIKDIKNYHPQSTSLSSNQTLFKTYNYLKAQTILIEMVDNLVLELNEKKLKTGKIGLYVSYQNEWFKASVSFVPTCNYQIILKHFLYLYGKNKLNKIRKIGICFSKLQANNSVQLNLFTTDDYKLINSVIAIKDKFGKNSILRGISYLEEATGKDRNQMIGGHHV